MMADIVDEYRNVIITPEAAERLADWIEQCVKEVNIRYPRGKTFTLQRSIRNDDMLPSFLSVSDGTEKAAVYITLSPVTDIIDTSEDL